MKRLLTAALALAATASLSQAAVIISSTRTAGATYDTVNFRVAGLTGADNTTGGITSTDANGDPLTSFPAVIALNGTFSAGAGSTLTAPGTTTSWKGNWTNSSGQDGSSNNRSFLDMDNQLAISRNPSSATPTSVTVTGGVLAGGEYRLTPTDITVGTDDGSFDNTLLAQIYVTHGGAVSFAGQITTLGGGVSDISFANLVPEPASLSLLGLGVLGLAARRRQA